MASKRTWEMTDYQMLQQVIQSEATIETLNAQLNEISRQLSSHAAGLHMVANALAQRLEDGLAERKAAQGS